MTIDEYRAVRALVIARGHGGDIEWSENLTPVKTVHVFFREYVFVVCNSGMKWAIAQNIFIKVMDAVVNKKQSARTAYGHPAKAAAIDWVFERRRKLFNAYRKADDKLAFCRTMPWIGPITCYHLAKNYGLNLAKPDRHLERIARDYGTTTHDLCAKLAKLSGDRIATVDVVLWRAAAIGIIQPTK